MPNKIDLLKLREPFSNKDIKWRLQSSGKNNNGFWALVIPYITNRSVMQRLDDVCGSENWKNEFQKAPEGGVMCGISIRIEGEWVTKWDAAANTEVKDGGQLNEDTNVKGGFSASMKRAGVPWGIGRYLYDMNAEFATIMSDGLFRGKTKTGEEFRWNPPVSLQRPSSPVGTVKMDTEELEIAKKNVLMYLRMSPPVYNEEWINWANESLLKNNLKELNQCIDCALKVIKKREEKHD